MLTTIMFIQAYNASANVIARCCFKIKSDQESCMPRFFSCSAIGPFNEGRISKKLNTYGIASMVFVKDYT